MSDIIKSSVSAKDLISRLKSKQKAKPGQAPGDKCLLLDLSGSMEGEREAKLGELAEEFTHVRRFVFSDRCKEIGSDERLPYADGGTAMHRAFDHIKAQGIKHCVIITDGQPDSEEWALDSSAGLKVDIYYVGPPPAPPFLEKLAGSTGGKYGNVSLDDWKQLSTTITGLLGPASDTIQL